MPSPAIVTTSEVLPIGVAKMAVGEALVELALGDPADVAAGAGDGGDRVVAGEDREVGALVGLVLEGLEVVEVGRAIHDLDDVPAEGRLDRRQDVARP